LEGDFSLTAPRFRRGRSFRPNGRGLVRPHGAGAALGSQQDSNLLLARRSVLGVLKIANPAFSEAEIDMEQDAAAAHIAGGVPDLAGRRP